MIYVHKILPLLVSPLGLALAFLLLALVVRRRWPVLGAIVVLCAFSTQWVADRLFAYVEGPGPKLAVQALPNANAVVVLSGMLATPAAVPNGYEWGGASDRFFDGLAAFQAGKAPLLVFTAGKLPWERHASNEGARLVQKAHQLGVPMPNIRLTAPVENTADEAREVAKLLGNKKRVILVTSAFHMPRAASLFERQGLDVVRFAVDYRVEERQTTPMTFMPDADALDKSSDAIRELLGRAYYAIKR
jgi:uncharacterized SAM-binding protein YcdF (DUF218 family)